MRIAHFDPFSGASGDMILGSLLDAGLSLDGLRSELAKLHLHGFALEASKLKRHGLAATKAQVLLEDHPHTPTPTHAHTHTPPPPTPTHPHTHTPAHKHRRLPDILALIDRSELPERDRARAAAVFRRLAQAEARVHACAVDEIHFHEVGAVDAIVDIVGAVVGLRLLGIERVVSGPLRTGTGFVDCAHGRIPVPAPATAELLSGFPSVGTEIEGELTTPTGAALLTTLADEFGPRPEMAIEAVGYGAGSRERDELPNLLRVFIGQAAADTEADEVAVIEANLDDLSPEIAGHVVERLLEAGALDATLTPVYMKKNRPGILLSVIAEPASTTAIEELILAETSTFGIRRTRASRRKLFRSWVEVATPYGALRVKTGRLGDRIVQASPEFEDCRQAAARHDIPLKDVYQAAMDAYRHHGSR